MTSLVNDLNEMYLKIQRIKNTFANTGTIEVEDLEFLCDRTIKHVIMSHIAETDWVKLKTLQVTSSLEIEDLVRQVETT